jgi:hypothetical protein
MHRRAAIDQKRLAGHEIAVMRCEEQQCPDEVVGRFLTFYKMSRSIRSRSFSRRSREISAAGSGTECGADAGIGRSADPPSRPPLPLRQLRSIEGEMPSSLAIWLNGRPLLTSRAIASCLNSSLK